MFWYLTWHEKFLQAPWYNVLQHKILWFRFVSVSAESFGQIFSFGFGIGPKPKRWFRSYTTRLYGNAKDLIKNNLYKHRVGRPEPKLPLSTLCMMKFLKVRSFWRNQLLLLAKTVIHLQQWICALPSDHSSVLFYSFKHYRVALNSYGQKVDITHTAYS